MDLTWISVDDVVNTFPKTPRYRLNKIDRLLKEKYPDGKDWLETDIKNKQPIRDTITDLQHILTWAWDRKLFIHKQYSVKLEEYILSGYFNHMNLTLTNFALRKQLIDENLMKGMEKISPGLHTYLRKGTIILCLFTMKKFQDILDEDILKYKKILDRINDKHQQFNCFRLIQTLRINFGYSAKIFKREIPNNWDFLIKNYPDLKDIIIKYKNSLLTSELSRSVIKGRSIQLKQFLKYISENELNLNNFKRIDFIHYFESLKKRYKNLATFKLQITNIKAFFVWGIEVEEDYTNFPNVLDFPYDYYLRINRKSNKQYYNSEGHTFENENIASDFVRALKEFRPEDESEELSSKYMMVLCSVPCRLDYVRNLPVDCLFYMENSSVLYGISSFIPDKAGNINGQFPILDKMGLEAIHWLQERVKNKGFTPIENPDSKKEYVHLFQFEGHPFILTVGRINNVIDKIKKGMSEKYREANITPHKFRTHILTEITSRTRNIEVTQTAAGHRSSNMTKNYMRSDISKDALLNTIQEGFDKGEYSGKFYLRLIEALTTDDLNNDEILEALNKEISLNDFLKQFGRRRDMGYCLVQGDCANHYKCWGCKHFFMKRDEIETAIETLSKHLINFNTLMKYSKDFTFDNPIVASKQKSIGLIIKHICHLGFTPEQVMELVSKHVQGQKITGVTTK